LDHGFRHGSPLPAAISSRHAPPPGERELVRDRLARGAPAPWPDMARRRAQRVPGAARRGRARWLLRADAPYSFRLSSATSSSIVTMSARAPRTLLRTGRRPAVSRLAAGPPDRAARRRALPSRARHSLLRPTLEWFVAAVLEREFGMATAWNVRLEGTAVGGDYDAIGFAEATLVYVETNRPRHATSRRPRCGRFFDRVDTLRPGVAVFLNDTQLRMATRLRCCSPTRRGAALVTAQSVRWWSVSTGRPSWLAST